MKGKSMGSIGMAGCKLRVEGAKAVAELASVTSSLTRLDVSGNYLDRGGSGVQLLRDAVKGREGFELIDYQND